MGWHGVPGRPGRALWTCDCGYQVETLADGPGACPRCTAYLGATHGARHWWAGLALAGACAEATQQAVDYLARSGAEDAPVARGVLWAAAEALADRWHTRGWRAR